LEEVFHRIDGDYNEIRMDQEGLEKAIAKAHTAKEQVLVQLNILRLQVEKIREQVSMKSDELISLENRRSQLQLSMQERLLEIEAHSSALKVQLKTEEESRHLAVCELQDREKTLSTLQAKYQIVMSQYMVDGEEVSQTYNMITFVKEREALETRGNDLNDEVQNIIHELSILEKQKKLMDEDNTSFMNNQKGDETKEEEKEKKQNLEEQLKVAKGRLSTRKSEAAQVFEQKNALAQTY
jgi:chromosome segregation ATPase